MLDSPSQKLSHNMDKNALVTLEGHTNVVYCLDFNNPFGDRVATGSFQSCETACGGAAPRRGTRRGAAAA